MRALRSLFGVAVLMIAAAAFFLLWQKRPYRASPAATAAFTDTASVPRLYPGGEPPATLPPPGTNTHEGLTASDISEGKQLYHTFNCVACHANGGGGIGPALMDDLWIYGSEPRDIYASILEGRPNGMPSFRGKIPDAQVWQLVAYIRSMSGLVPLQVRPGRDDHMAAKKPESMVKTQPPHATTQPTGDRKATTR